MKLGVWCGYYTSTTVYGRLDVDGKMREVADLHSGTALDNSALFRIIDRSVALKRKLSADEAGAIALEMALKG